MKRLVLTICALTLACRSEEAKPREPDRSERANAIALSPEAVRSAGIESVPASRAALRPSVPASGFIRPDARRSVTVRAPGGGRVVSLAVDVGERVSRAEPLAMIDSPEATSALARARTAAARAGTARRALERAERLLAVEAVSRTERNTRQAEAEATTAEAAAAALDLARLHLGPADDGSRLSVTAPRSGTVLEIATAEGSLVEKDAPLVSLADLGEVWAILEVPEVSDIAVATGESVEVRIDGLPDRRFLGRVAITEPTLGASTGRQQVRVIINNGDARLRPGMLASCDLPLKRPPSEASVVPVDAIQQLFGQTSVFVDEGGGRYALRAVDVGRESGGRVEVLRGLKEGERVVSRGAFALKTELLESSLATEDEP